MTASLASPMTDTDWMKMALAMGRRGQGRTAENPAVGCVIVDASGALAGIGHTQAGGRPHAETAALSMAGTRAKGGTAYVTLEPCMMCAKLIHHAGIGRVVIVDGGFGGENGVGYLEDHGVTVQRTDGPKDPRNL